MGQNTAISWSKHTWNPWQGCTKVSAGCDFCYMFRDKIKYGQNPELVVRSQPATFQKPLLWHNRLTGQEPFTDRLVFTCSWSDFFHPDADEWRPDAWQIIRNTPNLIYQILTKRPNRVLRNLPPDWGEGYANVWLGVTVEDQDAANRRIPLLKEWKAPIRFVSFEPLLEEIDLNDFLDGPEQTAWDNELQEHITFRTGKLPFEWGIIGGESGNEKGMYRYRACQLDWIDLLEAQITMAGSAAYIKQLGTYQYHQLGLQDRAGANPDEWPANQSGRSFQRFPKSSIALS